MEYLRFKLKRAWRRQRRQWRVWAGWAANYLDRHVWGKWRSFGIVRRLILIWIGSLLLLGVGLWQQAGRLPLAAERRQTVAAGRYSEAVIGPLKTLNPVLPDGGATASANRLIFSGLTRYGRSSRLEPDLAESWSVSSDLRTYSFKLRPDVKWHDGAPFTSRDVAFTVAFLQNPDTRSPLAATWQGVKYELKGDLAIDLILPVPYAAFIHSTTVGLLPSHELEGVEPKALRLANFNQAPIGTGPFKVKNFVAAERRLLLEANEHYFGGAPRLREVELRAYNTAGEALQAYAKRQVSGISRLTPDLVAAAEKLDSKIYELRLPETNYVFFNLTDPVLQDKSVRQALALATDRTALIRQALAGQALPVSSPLPAEHLGGPVSGGSLLYDLAAAAARLDQSGWTKGSDGFRGKGGSALALTLVTTDQAEFTRVASSLRDQWQQVGIKTEVVTVDNNELQQSYIKPRRFQVLLYGLNLGADPDVYDYWHSSQGRAPGLNLSQYQSDAADRALESGRILRNPEQRAAKYRAFAAAFIDDIPALPLYSPYYLYVVSNQVAGITARRLVDPADRFYGIEDWVLLAN